jgi:predicted transcriptional regulator
MRGEVPKATPLDPWRLYDVESTKVLVAVAKHIATRGIAPSLETIVKRSSWHSKSVQRYLLDLVRVGYLRPTVGRGFALTEKGSSALGVVHTEPILPTNTKLMKKAIAEAHKMAKKLEDPSLLGAFAKVFGAENVKKLTENIGDASIIETPQAKES